MHGVDIDGHNVADDERLRASLLEGAGFIKLECNDGRVLEVIDAEWTEEPTGVQSTRVQRSDTTSIPCSGTDEAASKLFKQLCNGQ